MRPLPRVQIFITLTLLGVLFGCGGGSTSSSTTPTDNNNPAELPLGTFVFGRASGSSAQVAGARRASRLPGVRPRILGSQTPESGTGRIFLMDHHGAQGSESTIGGTADYESVNLSADRRKIVFCAYASNGYYQIFTSNTDATQITQLTRDLEDHWEAHFSPDGTKIVYVRGFGALGLMNTSGGPEKTVDTDRFYIDHPIILSNGKILFEGFDSEMDQFFTVNQDGTGLMSFTNTLSTPSYYFEDIAVSPDGKKIAFSAYDRGTETDNVFIADFNAAALDTYETVLSNIVQLTTTSPVADRSMDPMFVDDRIVFVTFGDTEPVGAGDYMEIYSMKYDGSDLQRLTKNTDYEWFMVPYYYYSN